MRLSTVRLTLGLAAVIAFTAVPAFAQHHGGGGHSGGNGGGRASGGHAASARSGGARVATGGARTFSAPSVAPRANYAVRGGVAPRGSSARASRYSGISARVAPVRF